MRVFITKTLVILALAFGQYDCRRTFNSNLCHQVTIICTIPVPDMVQNVVPASFDIDIGCTTFNTIRNCIGGCLRFAWQGRDKRALVRALEYICDPSRRDEVRAASRAECFRDRSLQSTFEQRGQACVLSVQQHFDRSAIGSWGDVGQVCPMVNNMADCLMDEVRDMCGAAVVPVFSGMFQFALGEWLGDSTLESCITQHSIVRRAVSTFFEQVRK